MTDSLPSEKVAYTRGQKLWWKGSGYGYTGRIPVIAKQMSATGKTCLVGFMSARYAREQLRYVQLHMLELRDE